MVSVESGLRGLGTHSKSPQKVYILDKRTPPPIHILGMAMYLVCFRIGSYHYADESSCHDNIRSSLRMRDLARVLYTPN